MINIDPIRLFLYIRVDKCYWQCETLIIMYVLAYTHLDIHVRYCFVYIVYRCAAVDSHKIGTLDYIFKCEFFQISPKC